MNRWDECLQSFSGATDLYISPNDQSRFCRGTEWLESSSEPWTAEECDQLCLHLLSEENKHRLADEREVSFVLEDKAVGRLRGHVFVEGDGFCFHFRKHFLSVPSCQELHIPRAASDLFQSQRGLIVIAGGAGQGKTTSLASILQGELDRSYRMISMVEDCPEISLTGRFRRIEARAQRALPCDILSVDTGFTATSLELAVKHAASGKLAILVLPFESVSLALGAISRGLEAWNLGPYQKTFFEYFHGAISQKLLRAPSLERGAESELIPAFEICVATPAIKDMVKNGALDNLRDTIARSGESSGMRTLNQSLLQLILRRKVDMKEAFQASHYPEELDEMLSKAGV